MNNKLSRLALATLTFAGVLCSAGPAAAQVAGGSTTVGVAVVESTQIAMGWSVKKSLLGKTIFNEAGQKVGNVEDLIISPDKNVSYIIVGAGGFIGIGRHDVAIPVTQIKDQAGKLVMTGATEDMIKAMPAFDYADHNMKRDQFVAAAEKDIAKGKAKVAELENQAAAAAAEAKAGIELKIGVLKDDVKSAEAKLGEMKQATAAHWKTFEEGVSAAIARMHKSIETAMK